MNKAITTNQIPPIAERKEKKRTIITSNEVQPNREEPKADRKRLDLKGVITTATVEQLKKAREQKEPEKESPKRKEKR